MDICVVSDCDIRMAEKFTDSLYIFPIRKKSTCKSMTKGMQAIDLIIFKSCRNSNLSKHSVKISWSNRLASFCSENVIKCASNLFQPEKSAISVIIEMHVPCTGLRLS